MHRFRANEGHCTLIFEVNGGTGRFQNASGVLTYTENAEPVLFDASGRVWHLVQKWARLRERSQAWVRTRIAKESGDRRLTPFGNSKP